MLIALFPLLGRRRPTKDSTLVDPAMGGWISESTMRNKRNSAPPTSVVPLSMISTSIQLDRGLGEQPLRCTSTRSTRKSPDHVERGSYGSLPRGLGRNTHQLYQPRSDCEPGIPSAPMLLGRSRLFLVFFIATVVLFKGRGPVPKLV